MEKAGEWIFGCLQQKCVLKTEQLKRLTTYLTSGIMIPGSSR